jgi:hypothetical protein
MSSIKGHFDGNAVVLDEPASLTVGQLVRVIVETNSASAAGTPETFNPHTDATSMLMNGEGWDEREAVKLDPLDRVPADFVRQPGSAAGAIEMAPDFDETPEDFKDYL